MVTKTIKNYLFYLILSCFGLVCSAQESQRYAGPMTIGNYSGNARYDYTLGNKDTVFNGSFLLQRSNLATLLEKEDASFSFKGHFIEGSPNLKWNFQFGEYKTNSQSKLVDYEYRVLISGLQEEGSGNLINGKPNGDWTYTVNKIKDSEVEQTLFKSNINFDNGIPNKSFQIENEKSVLVGRFLRNGLAHDEWSSYAANAIDDTENWFFNEGKLEKISINTNDVNQEIPVFTSNTDTYKTLTLNETYLEVLKATLAISEDSLNQQGYIPELLLENRNYYSKINAVLKQLGPSEFRSNFKVKVPFYELNSDETAILDTIVSFYKQADTIRKRILNNGHLNIVKRTDVETLYRYNATENISKIFLDPITQLVHYKEAGILEYLELPKIIMGLLPKERPKTKIIVPMDSANANRTFELANADNFNFEGNNLNAVYQIVDYAKTGLEQIKTDFAYQLTTMERLESLNNLEEDLINLNSSLEAAIDSVSKTLPPKHKKALKTIKTMSDQFLSDYAAINNPDEKLKFGNNLKICLQQLIILQETIAELPARKEEIKDLYKDAIWNPFMAIVMEEEVKKRITSNYTNTLLPYFLESIATELTCDSAEEWTNQIIETNKRVIALRDLDTWKLERKLKREKRPKEILKLLFQPLTAKKQ